MKCRVCKQEFIPFGTLCGMCADPNCAHHRRPSPLGDCELCWGCAEATLAIEKYVLQKTDRSIIGDWVSGWLQELIANPTKHREGLQEWGGLLGGEPVRPPSMRDILGECRKFLADNSIAGGPSISPLLQKIDEALKPGEATPTPGG